MHFQRRFRDRTINVRRFGIALRGTRTAHSAAHRSLPEQLSTNVVIGFPAGAVECPAHVPAERELMPECLPQFGGYFRSLTGGRADVKARGDDKEDSSHRPAIDGGGEAKPACFVKRVGVECP